MPTTLMPSGSFTVYADESFSGTPAFDWEATTNFVNYGTVSSKTIAFSCWNAGGLLENRGLVQVQAGAGTGRGLYSPNWNSNIVNYGTWSVAGDTAYGILTWSVSNTYTNNGHWIVAGDHSAYGFYLENGGNVYNTNDLTVSAPNGQAVGIFEDRYGYVNNSGSITVTGQTGFGVVLAEAVGGPDPNVVNSGTITAQYAIVGVPNGGVVPWFNILNTGTINGIIDLERADDVLVNRGVIHGDVYMYLGNDLVDTTLGFIDGAVFLEDGNDEYRGGAYNSYVDGGVGDDKLTGGSGNDEFYGGSGADVLSGGDGNDILDGGSAPDVISGGNGNDILLGGTGNDTLDGGAGFDLADYEKATAGVVVSLVLAGVAQNTVGDGTDTLTGIEDLAGSAFNDTLTGDGSANFLYGLAGADVITGGGGNDTLSGGLGIDTANYASASTSDSWHRNLDGSWTITAGSEGTDTLTGVEFAHFTDRDVFLARASETFSGDGASDIFFRNSTSGALAMWFLNGASITGASPGTIDASFSTLGYGDLNGDGRDDILWRDASGSLSLWEMNGAAHTAISLGNVSTAWNVAGIGDLNGDGVDDILWRNGSGDMSIWFQDANGGHAGASLGNVDPSWVIEAFGDFNGDGKQDFLWRNTVSGDMSLWFMNGTTVTGGQFAHVGQPWVVEGTGDFNGDGRDDVLWRNSVTGDMSIWMMDGQTLVSQPGYSVGPSWHIAAIGDYNGDGKDDLIWWNDDGTLVEWLMNGGAITSTFSPGSLDHSWIINPGG